MVLNSFEHDGDDWDKHWAELGSGMRNNPTRDLRHREIVSMLSNEMDTKILDFGAGDGQLVRTLLSKGFNATGWEQSQKGVEIANELIRQSGFVNSVFHVTDIDKREVELFDVIVLSEVLEHLDDPQETLKTLSFFLRENGCFIITVPSGPVTFFDEFIGHRRHYSRRSLNGTLKGVDLNSIVIRSVGFPIVNIVRITCMIFGKRMPQFVKKAGLKERRKPTSLIKALLYISSLDTPLGWQLVCKARKSNLGID